MARWFVLRAAGFGDLSVEVSPSDEGAWTDALRYFGDCGLKFETEEAAGPPAGTLWTPGEASDILCPRDP